MTRSRLRVDARERLVVEVRDPDSPLADSDRIRPRPERDVPDDVVRLGVDDARELGGTVIGVARVA